MKIISKETSKRVCDHMNNDHLDSVHKYLIHYGKISSFENAHMEEINNSYIKIKYDGQSAIIKFKASSRLSMLSFEECKRITDYYENNN